MKWFTFSKRHTKPLNWDFEREYTAKKLIKRMFVELMESSDYLGGWSRELTGECSLFGMGQNLLPIMVVDFLRFEGCGSVCSCCKMFQLWFQISFQIMQKINQKLKHKHQHALTSMIDFFVQHFTFISSSTSPHLFSSTLKLIWDHISVLFQRLSSVKRRFFSDGKMMQNLP